MSDTTFDQAKDWYQNRATRLEIAGVKIRMFNCYENITDEKEAFILAVKDEQLKKPLPNS